MLEKRLLIVSGKGGVGKSAVTAALSLAAQRHGLRVLAMEMAGSGGLSAHFSTGPLEFEPREIRPGLHAMRMDRSDALLEFLSVQLSMKSVSRFGTMARAFDALATTAPGIREILTIGKAVWEVNADRWDVVVADGPPTGQIGSFLRAPKTIKELVPSGRIREEADMMADLLSDDEKTRTVLVTLPEELPTTETMETLEWLRSENVVAEPYLVANRTLAKLDDPTTPEGPVGDAAQLHRSLWSGQQEWMAKLNTDIQLPYLFGLFTPGEVAARICDEFEAVL